MEISSVDLSRTRDSSGRVLAFASVVFDEEFVVHNIRLVRAKTGLIVAMPNEEYRGRLRDIAHPLNNSLRRKILDAVVQGYNREVEPDKQLEV